MREDVGNIWTYPTDAVVITTNGVVRANGSCVMGAGCAKEARDYFPGLDRYLGKYLTNGGNRVYPLGRWESSKYGQKLIFSFPVKHHWKDSADLALIEKSAEQLADWADYLFSDKVINRPPKTFVLPRPGCGYGGLRWNEVKPILVRHLDDRFTCLTFKR